MPLRLTDESSLDAYMLCVREDGSSFVIAPDGTVTETPAGQQPIPGIRIEWLDDEPTGATRLSLEPREGE